MDTLVSVIVPVYMVEPFLLKCVNSIVNQTYKNLEIILVEDGSPDRCGEMCDEMAGVDNRINVIHQANQGLSVARNRGVDACSGDYIVFVDSDDYIEPNTVECMLQASIDTCADVTCCGYYEEKTKRSVSHQLVDALECYEGEAVVIASMKGDFAPFAWNKLWKRKLFDDIRFPPGRYFEDLSTNWKIFNDCHRVTCVPDVLFHYTVRRESISNKKTMKNLIDRWIAFKERYDVMAGKSKLFCQICTKGCLDTIGYTWRWLYIVDREDRIEHEGNLNEMKSFLENHQDYLSSCSFPTRFSLFCAHHSGPLSLASCYYLNQIYRKFSGRDWIF